MQRNIYPEIGEAELYMHGIDGSGYVFLITIKSNMDLMSKVDVYSKVSTGDFKQFIEIVKYAVDGNEGCPH